LLKAREFFEMSRKMAHDVMRYHVVVVRYGSFNDR
jgi:hypothetical protein